MQVQSHSVTHNLSVMLMLTGAEMLKTESLIQAVFKYLGAPVTWSSKKQTLVTLSSTEAEYIALSEAVKEAVWMKGLLEDFNQHVPPPIHIYEDNQNCIRLLKNERSSLRTKHTDVKYNFVPDWYNLMSCTVIASL